MALLFEWTDGQKRAWDEWVAARPDSVRLLCERLPPNRLYRIKSTNQRVTIYSYAEDNTVTVNVSGQYNVIVFERQVFGVDANDLEECDMPSPNEPLGAMMQI